MHLSIVYLSLLTSLVTNGVSVSREDKDGCLAVPVDSFYIGKGMQEYSIKKQGDFYFWKNRPALRCGALLSGMLE